MSIERLEMKIMGVSAYIGLRLSDYPLITSSRSL